MKSFLGIPLPSFNGTTSGDTTTEAAVSPLLADVARPIAGEAPSGRDVSYEPDFLRLKQEIDRLNAIDIRVDQEQATDLTRQLKNARGRQSPESGAHATTNGAARAAAFDADLVVSLAHAILKDQSKDLRAAAYLALGLSRRDGIQGVAEGTQAIELVARLFWATAFPPMARMAARMNALDAGLAWLREAVDQAQPAGRHPDGREATAGPAFPVLTQDDRAALESASRAVTSLRELAAAWNNDRVMQRISGLATSLSDAASKLPVEAAPAIRTPRARPKPAVPPTNGTDRTVAIPVAPEAAPASTVNGADPVVERASRLLKEDATRSLPYRLVRVYRWDPLVQEPRHTNKRTLIEPPPARRREYIARLHAEQQWMEVVLQGEETFGQNPFHFWLDLHRHILDALNALGPAYAAAREAAMSELQRLVGRIPSLPTLSFADGTRFASPAVVAWLEESAAPASAKSNGNVVERRPSNDTADAFPEARKRFIDGDLNGALALLERSAANDTSDRQRFQRRVYMASLCIEAGQVAVARALLEELAQTIDVHGLARWEPELAMTVWTRQYACFASIAGRLARGPEADQLAREMESVFGRICRIDTSRALATAQEARRPP